MSVEEVFGAKSGPMPSLFAIDAIFIDADVGGFWLVIHSPLLFFSVLYSVEQLIISRIIACSEDSI
jgi:hypothetical protein